MYVRSLKQNANGSRSRSVASSAATTTSSSSAATAAAPPPIWSAIALQRHYASMLPQGLLPPTTTTSTSSINSSAGGGHSQGTMTSVNSSAGMSGNATTTSSGSGRNAVRNARSNAAGGTSSPSPPPPAVPVGARGGVLVGPTNSTAASALPHAPSVPAGGKKAVGGGVGGKRVMAPTPVASQRRQLHGTGASPSPPPPPTVPPSVSAQNIPITAPHMTRFGVAIAASGAVHTSHKEQLAAAALGLIQLPPPPPSTDDWSDAVSQACSRGKAGGSEHHACPICLERFMTTPNAPQVILNCSHVFHKTCLAQLEKFLFKAKEKICCPMCRKGNYYKRPLVEGKAQLADMAATKIQAWVRGRRARRAYLTLRLKANPQFRSDFAYAQLSKISDYYLNSALAREKEVEELLERMDLERHKAMADMMSDADWDAIRMQVLRRALEPDTAAAGGDDGDECAGGVECPICMVAVVDEETGDCCPSAVMLSCTHVFHGACLDAFERMGGGAGGKPSASGDGVAIPRCAVCRKGYARRPLIDTR